MKGDIDRWIAVYRRQGWYPAKWAHLPQPVKDALRSMRFRPRAKCCWMNCQRLLIFGPDLGLRYREGWIIGARSAPIPIEHAWLELDGETVDPTLPDVAEYLDSYEVPAEEVRGVIARLGVWTATRPRKLWEISPWVKGIRDIDPAAADRLIGAMP